MSNAIQFVGQHEEAIVASIRVKNEITAEFFDDKVRPMGSIKIEDGKIAINVYSPPSLISSEASGAFLAESISLAIKACWNEKPGAFKERFKCSS